LNSEHYIGDLNDIIFLFAERTNNVGLTGQTKRIFVRGNVGKNTRRRAIIKKK